MRLVRSSYNILTPREEITSMPLIIEERARVAYQSSPKGDPYSFVQMLKLKGHLSTFEHCSISVSFICDRGVSHELVRHRLTSFTQESTRYCKYAGQVTFIIPSWITSIEEGTYSQKEICLGLKGTTFAEEEWLSAMVLAEISYKNLLDQGWTAQQARSVLPNSLKTEIVVTANLREWLHIFSLRTAKEAHPDMRALMIPLEKELTLLSNVIFQQ